MRAWSKFQGRLEHAAVGVIFERSRTQEIGGLMMNGGWYPVFRVGLRIFLPLGCEVWNGERECRVADRFGFGHLDS
jgi:hypothetical protein